MTLNCGSSSITGASGALTLTDSHGGNTLTGGSGAFSVTDLAGDDVITTGTSASNSVFSAAAAAAGTRSPSLAQRPSSAAAGRRA